MLSRKKIARQSEMVWWMVLVDLAWNDPLHFSKPNSHFRIYCCLMCMCRVGSNNCGAGEWHLADEDRRCSEVSENDATQSFCTGIHCACTRWRRHADYTKSYKRVNPRNSHFCLQLISNVNVHEIWNSFVQNVLMLFYLKVLCQMRMTLLKLTTWKVTMQAFRFTS